MFLVFISFFGCETSPVNIVITEQYELHVPENQQKLLILFPGFFGNAKRVLKESILVEKCTQENIAVLLLNYNGKLFLTKAEKQDLSEQVSEAIQENDLSIAEIYLGGFSSGGNLALLLAKQLEKFQGGKFKATGVFVIDSPVDLAQLYQSSKETIDKNYSEASVKEAKFIIAYLEGKLGNPCDNLSNYERLSPFLAKTNYIENIQFETTAVKIYTEPALEWNKKYRGRNFEELNAFQLKQMAKALLENGVEVDYYQTENQGYRSNGDRHPHSWSVLEEEEIVAWMTNRKP